MPRSAKISLSSIGRYHFYHLARQLSTSGELARLYTGYPKRMAVASGVPRELVESYPWLVAPRMAAGRYLPLSSRLLAQYDDISQRVFDDWVSRTLEPCDIFHSLSRYALAAGRRAKALGAKFVCEVGSSHILSQLEMLELAHSAAGLRPEGLPPHGVKRELSEYDLADKIVVLSKSSERSFLEKGVPASKVVCIPLGVDFSRFNRPQNKASETFRVLFVGHVGVRKGALNLAKAFRALNLKNSELLFIGTVDPRVGKSISDLGGDNIKLVGPVPNGELSQYYSSASVFVLPSFEDGFGMVTLEALSCGCPVIVSKHAGSADVVKDGENGYIFDPTSIDQLKEKLSNLSQNRELLEEMGNNALNIRNSDMTWERHSIQVREMYANILNAD